MTQPTPGLSDAERREALIVATARVMHTCTGHPDYPDYDECGCGGSPEYHCEAGHEHGSRGVCWACEPLAAAIVDEVIAEAVDQARAEERERIAGELQERAQVFTGSGPQSTASRETYHAAARIARSQP